jgi:hypothetical protein
VESRYYGEEDKCEEGGSGVHVRNAVSRPLAVLKVIVIYVSKHCWRLSKSVSAEVTGNFIRIDESS